MVPKGGYEAAIARGGMMNNVFQSNLAFEQFVQSSGLTYGPQLPQALPAGWDYVGDAGEDRGWSEVSVAGLHI